jgi:lon-related putative ATP-dependent protease
MMIKNSHDNSAAGQATAAARCRLSPDQAGFSIPEDSFKLSADGGPGFAVIGQERAMVAMELALSIRAKGYNLFVSGPAGTGKRTAIHQVLKGLPVDLSRLKDICLVHDFKDPECPKPLYLPAGSAEGFRSSLRAFLVDINNTLADLEHNGQFRKLRDKLVLQTEKDQQHLVADFEARLAGEHFKIVQIEEGDEQKTDILPLRGEEVVDFEALQEEVSAGSLSEADYSAIRTRQMQLLDEMKELFDQLQKQRDEMAANLERIRMEILEPLVSEGLDALAATARGDGAINFLAEVRHHLLSDDSFIHHDPAEHQAAKEAEAGKNGTDPTSTVAIAPGASLLRGRFKNDLPEHLRVYDINILVDHQDTAANPVLVEQYADYAKLFGVIETPPEGVEPTPPFLMVRPGSLLKASGGYLVVRAEDLLRDEDLYVAVKRALLEESVEIRPPAGPFGQAAQAIKPQPVDIDLKLVVMGGDGIYELLFERDEEFQKLFKLPAEFDATVDRTPQICQSYADFLAMICREDKLLPLQAGAVAALLEHAVRVAEFRHKLTTRFSLLADILREANHWAARAKATAIGRDAVRKALSTREFLFNMPEEQIDEQIIQGEILMRVDGSAVGRINGLAVMDRGFYAFGRPVVISAQAAPGSEGVVNVERESGLSGEIHDKGTFIVASYIQANYARDFPLSIHASICFEQSYTEVDGDSASSAEIYALLSSIANLPLRQDVAVTGSMSQMGQIQPVGGVVEKIEGFFAVCRKIGLTGQQGVVIPHANVINLVLSPEVQDAIRAGRFHVWAIRTIDEGLEILTGVEAGQRNTKGQFPAGSVNHQVEKRLRDMAKATKAFDN